MDNVITLVAGSTWDALQVAFRDSNGVPVNLMGANSLVELQGHCDALGADKDINEEGEILGDGSDGIGRWPGVGAFVAAADLGELTEAVFACKGKFTDNSGKFSYGDLIYIRYVPPPITPPGP